MDQPQGGATAAPLWGQGTNARPLRAGTWLGRMGLEPHQALALIRSGHRFVIFPWCVSVILVSVKQMSAVHIVRSGDGTTRRAMRYVLGSLTLGWWGFPWGPIWTVMTVVRSLRGGIDITAAIDAEAGATLAAASLTFS